MPGIAGPRFPGGKRYRAVGPWLKERFGTRVRKVPVVTGSECTNRHRCLFCSDGIPSTGAAAPEDVSTQLREGTTRLAARHPGDRWLAWFRNFSPGHGPPAWLERQLHEAAAFPGVAGLVIGMRPDDLDGPLADRLARLARTVPLWVELGLQSCDDTLLHEMRRGHPVGVFTRAAGLLHARGIGTVAHLVFGWPGETDQAADHAADLLSECRVRGVKLHHLQVLAGTGLADRYRATPFPCLDAPAYIERLVRFLTRLDPGIAIHRLFTRSPTDRILAPRWPQSQQALNGLLDHRLQALETWQGAMHTGAGAGRPDRPRQGS